MKLFLFTICKTSNSEETDICTHLQPVRCLFCRTALLHKQCSYFFLRIQTMALGFCEHSDDILCTQWWHSVNTMMTFCEHNDDILWTQWWHSVNSDDILRTQWWYSANTVMTFCEHSDGILWTQWWHFVNRVMTFPEL